MVYHQILVCLPIVGSALVHEPGHPSERNHFSLIEHPVLKSIDQQARSPEQVSGIPFVIEGIEAPGILEDRALSTHTFTTRVTLLPPCSL